MPSKYTYPTSDEFKELREKGRTYAEIAQEYGIPYTTFYKYCLKKNWNTNQTVKAPAAKVDRSRAYETIRENIDVVLLMIRDGYSFRSIGAKLGVSPRTLQSHLHKYGICMKTVLDKGLDAVKSEYLADNASGKDFMRRSKGAAPTATWVDGVYMFECEICGKHVETVHMAEWAYKVQLKNERHNACSYSCCNRLKAKLGVV